MHEMSIAQTILEQLDTLAGEYAPQRITRVRLVWGELQQIHEPSLREAMRILLHDGPMADMTLDLTCEPIQGRCRPCDVIFNLDEANFTCPTCSRDDYDILPDRPLTLEQIDLTDDSNGAPL